MYTTVIDTPLGLLYAKADHKALYYLGFEVQEIPAGNTPPLQQIRTEIAAYFRGEIKNFQTPIALNGSDFQNKVWKALMRIPFGKTKSYKEIGSEIDCPKGSRAVGNANGANPFLIIVPCHRVIASDGTLGGYSAGIDKKEWLLSHERNSGAAPFNLHCEVY